MPNVFVEVELILKLAKHYDAKDRTFKSENRTPLLQITRDKIVEVFKLNSNTTVSILFFELCNDYE